MKSEVAWVVWVSSLRYEMTTQKGKIRYVHTPGFQYLIGFTKTDHTDTMLKHSPLLLFIALLLFSCGKNTLPPRDALSAKSEPYEMFSFQRSYPYPDFDWQGWRKTVQ
ncbi:MAG: hypothetical protein H7246_14980, partial [Phycisphaerae bacterium]|nr:hypothetical protein [Saprospiraceae bacterium]